MKYEVIKPGVCRHNRKLYRHGDVLTSDNPLDKQFPARFKKVEEELKEKKTSGRRKSGRRKSGRRKSGRRVEVPGELETGSETTALTLKPRGGGKYDVINQATGKKLNEVPMPKKEAEQIVAGGLNVEEDKD